MLPSRLFFDDSFFKGEENIKCDVYEKDGKVCDYDFKTVCIHGKIYCTGIGRAASYRIPGQGHRR